MTFRYQGPEPKGDQPKAIGELLEALRDGERYLTLLGATGTGKTVTMAKVIEALGRPALVLAPNKILAAQLAAEFRELFPENAVEYFISYYDYYQPEAYVPGKDLYIEKDASINPEIERLRHSTTRSLLSRRDVIVVASVSAIYGLGDPREYRARNLVVERGMRYPREALLERLLDLGYERNEIDLSPGRFRARGEVLEVFPAYETEPIRVELFGDEVERILQVHPITGERLRELPGFVLFPATHYLSPEGLEEILKEIEKELWERVRYFEERGEVLYAQRLKERTLYDLEMLRVMGTCPGVENYARYFTGKAPGEPQGIRERAQRGERTLVTVLTVRMAEELTDFLVEHGIRARYLHHELDAFERQALIRDLRLGHFDALVGINLLREGLDLPEVSLVAILDADKTGFLRSERSLIQTIGRAARNARGEVWLYADQVSEAMEKAIRETNRRRAIQEAYNLEHGIVPKTVEKGVRAVIRPEGYGEEAGPARVDLLLAEEAEEAFPLFPALLVEKGQEGRAWPEASHPFPLHPAEEGPRGELQLGEGGESPG
jgi:excinuclease UvrABC helicase subunit UvrB